MSFEHINFKLEVYEGPFDLLFKLIEKNEIDIYDIPISELTEQYITYIDTLQERDMESMSEFLLMAATLLEIKSKMLIPDLKNVESNSSVEEDPREELVRKLIDYKRFKEVTEKWRGFEADAEKRFFKQPEYKLLTMLKKQEIGGDSEIDVYQQRIENIRELVEGLTLTRLYEIFQDIMSRREAKTDKIRSGFNSVRKDLYTIESKIEYLNDLLSLRKQLLFTEVFDECKTKTEKVVTFLAMLELIKVLKIFIEQASIFGEIFIVQRNERNE